MAKQIVSPSSLCLPYNSPSRPGRPGETPRFVASLGSGPAGDRGAPPRGVDVKPLRQGPPGSPGSPGTGLGPCPEGPWDPGSPGSPDPEIRDPRPPGAGEAQNPVPGSRRVPDPVSGVPAQGFYINPSRRGPAVPGGGPGDRGPGEVPGRVPRGPEKGPGRPLASHPRPGEPRGPGARG